MLVLTRKQDTTIRIGEDIVIQVIRTGKGSVKLGIQAPAHTRILRGELDEFPATLNVGASQELVTLEVA